MSVIMRTPSGKIRLYCKGAVSVCLSPWQRMTAHHRHRPTHTHTHIHTQVLSALLLLLPLLLLSEDLFNEQQHILHTGNWQNKGYTNIIFHRKVLRNYQSILSQLLKYIQKNIISFWCSFYDWVRYSAMS